MLHQDIVAPLICLQMSLRSALAGVVGRVGCRLLRAPASVARTLDARGNSFFTGDVEARCRPSGIGVWCYGVGFSLRALVAQSDDGVESAGVIRSCEKRRFGTAEHLTERP